jgi:uncharacterized protein (TIGR02246 family)
MERAAVVAWVDAYVRAWAANSPEAIGALFSEDAVYSYHPYDEPVRGRKAIVTSWLEHPDPPGTWEASYEPIAVDGNVAVVHGRSLYFTDSARSELKNEWDNIFVIRFDDAGLCSSFGEWYVAPRKQAGG